MIAAALVVGVVTTVAALTGHPEVVRHFSATATWQSDGTARVHESIAYYFPESRHGIYRNLPGVSWDRALEIHVTADHTEDFTTEPDASDVRAQMDALGVDQITVDASEVGTKVKIGDPNRTVVGTHHYTIDYPLTDADLGNGRIGWDGVGAAWDVPIEATELEMLAPWRWEKPTCDVGSSGSVGGCTVTQPEPGRLMVAHGRLEAGEGITVYATRGAEIASAPKSATTVPRTLSDPWWQRPLALGPGVALLFALGALLVARVLRRAGRDWVMAGPASTGAATDLAFAAPSMPGVPPGAIRVDDSRLGEWAGTEFAPPDGLTAWQGGVLAAERALPEHRVAWLLEAAAAGVVEIDDTGSGAVTLRRGGTRVGETSQLLGVAFAGRDTLSLGAYDPSFSAMWKSVASTHKRWLANSVYVDHDADRRVKWAVIAGVIGFLAAAAIGITTAVLSSRFGLWVGITCGLAALVGGTSFGAAVRSWELHVRTPAGSAMWLRVESFRRFIAASEAEHVRAAATRGVLREYTAWAVALGEADHWNAMVIQAGLPPTTSGLSSAMLASSLSSACSSASTAPSSSSGGGGGGVGGGGGGGGGGSW